MSKDMVNEIRKLVEKSTDEEVRSLLFQMAVILHSKKEAGVSEEFILEDLMENFNRFRSYKEQARYSSLRNAERVHIVFGESSAGSLSVALKELESQDYVLSLHDSFSYGPIWKLHEEKGLSNRKETIQTIEAVPSHIPIYIWSGENALEYTGLRYVLYLLRSISNSIHFMNPSVIHPRLFPVEQVDYSLLHTGEISPRQWKGMLDQCASASPLSKPDRQGLVREWETLSTTEERLRIRKDGKLQSIEEDYYDNYLVQITREIHETQTERDYIKTARIIGEVMGSLEQSIGDSFFEYRIRTLILKGVFEIKGVPKAMRYYSVKLR
ncbi:DUF1835 domain-containing protein [Halobacillus halophilus]|uniref:DUF1835 domain-containing protein n=1 Tax=Halobacillus halophilus TaxID=1570 RepID=UPI001CD7B07B|nr:DUF1835 domain-containing protein [Halobacillus halophilus]MCA1011367.1 DUF1835 domain-containing protein [Halobacillus halophilus]